MLHPSSRPSLQAIRRARRTRDVLCRGLRHDRVRTRRTAFVTAPERLEARALLTLPPGLIAWWSGDGTPNDSAGTHNGVLVNGATYGPGRIGQAFSFDGVDDFVQVPDDDAWAFGNQDFTINLWANFDTIEPSTISHPQVVFIGNDEGSGSQNKWTFAFGGGTLHFHVNTPSGGEFIAAGSFTPSVGQWYHLAVTRSGSLYTTYVDGVPVGSETNTRTVPNANAPLTIGQSESPPEDLFMDGRIDEVQIYDRALSAGEIAELADPLRVTNTNDNGPGSLRQVLAYAAANPGADTATFDIPANDPNHVYYKDDGVSGQVTYDAAHVVPTTATDDSLIADIDPDWTHSWWRISPASNLVVDSAVTVDGYSQAGSRRNSQAQGDDAILRIELDGSTTPLAAAVVLAADGGALQGMAINRFGYTGAQLNAAATVRGCFIGTDPSGTVALPNGYVGVEMNAATSRVGVDGNGFDDTGGGLDDYAERNLISGNGVMGVRGPGMVAGNFIGTDRTGARVLPNGSLGVEAHPGARIGVDGRHANPAAERNLVSGNNALGIAAYAGSVVAGNYVGTDVSGTQPMGNGAGGGTGMELHGGAFVGSDGDGQGDDFERNVVSGNRFGIIAAGDGNQIAGNDIGTDPTGTFGIFQGWGVNIWGGTNNVLGFDDDHPVANPAAQRNIISGNDFGIEIHAGAAGNVIAGNYIGTNAGGIAELPNGTGISFVGGNHNRIGTDSDGQFDDLERNIISGNHGSGVSFRGGNDYNVVAGNYIGLDVTGTHALGNGGFNVSEGGVLFYLAWGVGNRIGVDGASANPAAGRNVIASTRADGRRSNGVMLSNSVSGMSLTGTVIAGNFIGTDATGTHITDPGLDELYGTTDDLLPLGGLNGVWLVWPDVTDTRVGTDGDGFGDQFEGNVIGGFAHNGVAFEQGASRALVAGNWIGTNPNGDNLGNPGSGVAIGGGTTDTQIGGPGPLGNTIAFSGGAGVFVGPGGIRNAIRCNSIHANTGLGIALQGGTEDSYTVTENDPGDVDDGPNGLQNFPVLALFQDGASTRIGGTLNSTPGATFTIDFYANSVVDPSGHGEGQRRLGSCVVTTDALGNAPFDVSGLGATDAGEFVTATATGPEGTSEFSAALAVTNAPPTADAGGPYVVSEGGPVTFDASASDDPDDDPLTYAWDVNGDNDFTDATGVGPTLTWAQLIGLGINDGPGARLVRVQVDDGQGHVVVSPAASLTIHNTPPTLGPITAPIDPTAVDTTINASAAFTDPGVLDTHTAVWDWGDGSTSAGVVSESNGSGTVSGSHAYTEAGVYTVTVTVTDKDGGSDTEAFQYVVVYDPSAGFVTGGGWITSPPGAYAADPAATGKANFGFVAKYKKGASVPDGQTQFQLHFASFNFISTSYDWLVVAGARAQYKGSGKINGTGDYAFMIKAIDGALPGGGGVDRFRIKIWDKGNGGIVYDNLMGGPDTDDPTTTLGGGNIVIHGGSNRGQSASRFVDEALSDWYAEPIAPEVSTVVVADEAPERAQASRPRRDRTAAR